MVTGTVFWKTWGNVWKLKLAESDASSSVELPYGRLCERGKRNTLGREGTHNSRDNRASRHPRSRSAKPLRCLASFPEEINMSGFEVAGIVLAVIPVFVEAGKCSASTASLLKNAAGSSTRDKKLQEFYDEFYWETYEMEKQMDQIVSNLPYLSEERKMEILSNREVQPCVQSWATDSDLAQALRAFFASENDLTIFIDTMNKVVRLFYQLVEDETVKLSKSDLDFAKISQKMKDFQAKKSHPSGFWDRVKFLRREKRRDICIANLRTWRSRLERIINYATRKAEKQSSHRHHPQRDWTVDSQASSLYNFRSLARRMFKALSRYWACSCGIPHQARLSLAACVKAMPKLKQTEIDFGFLVQSQGPWHEMMVLMKDISTMPAQTCAELGQICAAIEAICGQSAQYCLRVMVENPEDDVPQRVFQLTPTPRKFITNLIPVSFKELLLTTQQPQGLLIKRRLALTLAYSILQFHESAFLSSQWSEDQIYFFFSAGQAINYRQPYLDSPLGEAQFVATSAEGAATNPGIFHPNIGILRLGILLIEVHTWTPIEKFRVSSDTKDGKITPNADYAAALRVLDVSLGDCFPTYKSAIRACLDVDWVPAGSRVSLEDPATLNGLYRNVILPIQEEIEWGEKMAKKHGNSERLVR
ncbi:hypothetical protein DL769_009443 [Monosporascus sp. CRB-8-3]|nr:hypothetical protein DL769_009443 [Monosporascus sp. CRB-8-3]